MSPTAPAGATRPHGGPGSGPASTGTGTGLWRDRDFLRYWAGESVSRFGVQVTALTLPLLAVVDLGATAGQVGILNAAQFAPYLLVTLLIGVWVDRASRRPFLIAANLGRGCLLALLPALVLLGAGSVELLYLVGFAIGVLAVLYDLSSSAYLPGLVPAERLAEGNSKIQGSVSVARVGGPAAGGLLVHLLSVPAALFGNALAHLAAAGALLAIRGREAPRPEGVRKERMGRQIAGSLRFVLGNPYLRVFAYRAGLNNLFFMAMQTLLPLFVIRVLDLGGGALGLVLATGAAGSLVGAILAVRTARRFGTGRAIVLGLGLGSFAQLFPPLAVGPPAALLAVLLGAFLLGGVGTTIGNIHMATVLQSVTPRDLLGRTNAMIRFIAWGTMPFGALLGGFLGDRLGIRTTLLIVAAGFGISTLFIVLSPVARLRALPGTAGPKP